jgi:hypothetical protein
VPGLRGRAPGRRANGASYATRSWPRRSGGDPGCGIENNEFLDRADTAIFLGGGTDVAVRGNRIVASSAARLQRQGQAILLERSSGVTLRDNTVSDLDRGTAGLVEIEPDLIAPR